MSRFTSASRLIDWLLMALLAAVAFLLGCYEMGDSDIWWHLRGGQWILEHGRVPDLDPFTFGSADKQWIDIHWSYEVILALAHRLGGVGALVLLGATVGTGAFLAGLTARQKEWPAVAAVLSWLPALVLFSFRLDPRPEIFSALYIGCFLAVLWRVERRPILIWLLPILQVLWVNTQGLFVFGPVLLAMYVSARVTQLAWRRLRGGSVWTADERRCLWHLGGACVAVAAACFVSPYFVAAARFPFDLFPKVAEAGNVYKQYIDELMSPRDYVGQTTAIVAGTNWFFLAFYFLQLLVPLSFFYPALWRAWLASSLSGKASVERGATDANAVAAWFAGLAVVLGLLLVSTLTRSERWAPGLIKAAGDRVAWIFLLAGVAAALAWLRRSRAAALVAIVTGGAMTAWMEWLQQELLVDGRRSLDGSASASPAVLLLAMGAAALLVLYWEGNLFRVLLAVAFAFLGLKALQNWSRFGLVAGVIVAWNFGEWSYQLTADWKPGRVSKVARGCLRAGLAAVLTLWLAALTTDRYYIHTGEPRHFAFREQPLEFAHDAALFAGQPGLPEHALVYGLGQTGVYVYHNSPRCKPFLDGRLEMPDQKTFEKYVAIEDWLRQKDPRWEKAVSQLGNPLLLLEHTNNYAAEALLLAHPRWRCVYFDALASIFIPRDSETLACNAPTVDFVDRHFTEPVSRPVPDVRGAAGREQKALFNLTASLPRSPELFWRDRAPLLWVALDRARVALGEDPSRPDVWVLLGNCYWNLNPDLMAKPLTPAEPWIPERGVYWAQATYCLRQALELHPDNAPAWRYLFQAYGARGMADAQLAAGEQWIRTDPKATAGQRAQIGELRRASQAPLANKASNPEVGLAQLAQLLRTHHPEAAGRALQKMELQTQDGWNWSFAELAAGLCMHLGKPADARRIWQHALNCPSEAQRHCRVASTYWIELNFEAAIHEFQEAQSSNPQLAEAYWGLAMIHTELGRAAAAFEACRQGLRLELNERQHGDLIALEQVLRPYGSIHQQLSK